MANDRGFFGNICSVMSWMFAVINPSMIPIILSCVTSLAGLVNYYYQIKKNRQK